ncbi:MAG: polyprenyl synthetase family protein, partial [Bacteroidota bacterium]|nr:polyprenyl synthetase family protein [Bacteroidota bacterium]
MPVSLKEIKAPIREEMLVFEDKFLAAMQSRVPLLNRIMTYLVKRKGKQIRPMLVFLAAGVCGPTADKTYRGAALVELLHTATLIHDDVVDDSSERRGFFSLNALWKNKIAVLVGDYLLSRGLLLAIDNGDFDLLKLTSRAVREMSEGELLQLEKSRLLNISEDEYYDIINKKTASLIATCCAIGARSVTDNEETVHIMHSFGEKVGMVFQIKDDLFDYGEASIGKPVGIDLKEKKLTLPLIYALKQSKPAEQRHIMSLLRKGTARKKNRSEIVKFVAEKG